MDLDPDDIFKDDEDDPDNDLERASTKEFVVYLVDASPKMFSTTFQGCFRSEFGTGQIY
ncbi:ATP-dependent DNA helicase 2 subunit KU70 [Vitis vinifera]|uniref:ATP-dependent DNA helicase 2 subunit KU70 n=1 Tax=Vitis vinifera TaxID=29760 RepID=A0A438BTL2_VITVI|nr:ATP-dependent DNA helicase 2 subunit KU70 [Vitis vinifera]RVW82564.1 ATP-dependent DNA helicase 2 subunit KU70 [Vitis vinifera]